MKTELPTNNSETPIVIYVSVNVLPGAKEKFISDLKNIVAQARAVKGCLKYQWFTNPEDDNNYIVYGEFDTEENFLLYKKSEVTSNIGKLLLPALKGKPAFKHFKTLLFEQA